MSAILERGQFVVWFAYGLIAVAVYIVAREFLKEGESRAAADNLGDQRDRKASNPLVKYTRPFFTQYVSPIVRGKAFWDYFRAYYQRRLVSAGLSEEFDPDDFIAFKLFNIVFFPIIGGILKAGGFLDLSLFLILVSGVLGWFYPDLWMRSRIQKRQRQILKSMPFIVDLLALSTEAGLDFIGAIGKVVEKANPSPLVDEFAQLLKEIKVGSSRQEALREMGTRIGMTEINSFIAILISADQMGASIGRILRQQSDQIRSQRMLRAEKAGAAASQKVILPLVLFILPAVMLMIFGPFVLSMISPGQ